MSKTILRLTAVFALTTLLLMSGTPSASSQSGGGYNSVFFALIPDTATVVVNDTFQFTVSGGTAPYYFSIYAGDGRIESSTGLYSAPSTTGTATIKVQDANGNTRFSDIQIVEPLSISPASVTTDLTENVTFTTSGGVPDITFSMLSGPGSVDEFSGLYTRPWNSGTAMVRATDGNGATSDATITLNTGSLQVGTSGYDSIQGSLVDQDGNLIEVGTTAGFGSTLGGSDAFINKYDANGNSLHVVQFGTTGSDSANAVARDQSGNYYVAGYVSASLDSHTHYGSFDGFLAKYNGDVQPQWSAQFGSAAIDTANAVIVDGNGNVYVAGTANGSIDGQTYAGGRDGFLIKFDTSGNKVWTREFGSTSGEAVAGIALDGSGNIYLSGNASGEFDGQTIHGANDGFIVKYDSDGNRTWTRFFGTTGHDNAGNIAVSGSNVYWTGQTEGSMPGFTNAGGFDALVVKYDTSGNFVSALQFGDASDDYGLDIKLGGDGNLYVSGTQSADGVLVQGFLKQLTPSLVSNWTRLFGTSGVTQANTIALDDEGNLYPAGGTQSSFDNHTNAGSFEGFVLKYDSSGVRQ